MEVVNRGEFSVLPVAPLSALSLFYHINSGTVAFCIDNLQGRGGDPKPEHTYSVRIGSQQ